MLFQSDTFYQSARMQLESPSHWGARDGRSAQRGDSLHRSYWTRWPRRNNGGSNRRKRFSRYHESRRTGSGVQTRRHYRKTGTNPIRMRMLVTVPKLSSAITRERRKVEIKVLFKKYRNNLHGICILNQCKVFRYFSASR